MFTYVDIVGDACEGWINLFFDGECIALITDVDMAAKIKATTEPLYPVKEE